MNHIFFWERLPKFITNKRIRWMDGSINIFEKNEENI